jgi:hypothetical protein
VVISEQRERWLADGSPPVPTLVLGGEAHVLQHPQQAAKLLGFEVPARLRDAWEVAWDIDAVAQAWVEVVTVTDWDVLRTPLPRLERLPLALAVDAMVGIVALPPAFESGWFHWPGNPRTGETGDASVVAYEAEIVSTIGDREGLIAFVRPSAESWRTFLFEHEDEIRAEPDRPMHTPRGELPWVGLLEAQRLHAAQHYRQATTFIAAQGEPVPDVDFAGMHGLELPQFVY